MNTFETLTRLRAQRTGPRTVTGTHVVLPSSSSSSLLSWTDKPLRQTFVVTHIQGLHARPCVELIKAIAPFKCGVQVQCGEHVANGRSILGLLSLAAGCHSRVTFTMTGVDAASAMAAVRNLFESAFAVAYAPAATKEIS